MVDAEHEGRLIWKKAPLATVGKIYFVHVQTDANMASPFTFPVEVLCKRSVLTGHRLYRLGYVSVRHPGCVQFVCDRGWLTYRQYVKCCVLRPAVTYKHYRRAAFLDQVSHLRRIDPAADCRVICTYLNEADASLNSTRLLCREGQMTEDLRADDHHNFMTSLLASCQRQHLLQQKSQAGLKVGEQLRQQLSRLSDANLIHYRSVNDARCSLFPVYTVEFEKRLCSLFDLYDVGRLTDADGDRLVDRIRKAVDTVFPESSFAQVALESVHAGWRQWSPIDSSCAIQPVLGVNCFREDIKADPRKETIPSSQQELFATTRARLDILVRNYLRRRGGSSSSCQESSLTYALLFNSGLYDDMLNCYPHASVFGGPSSLMPRALLRSHRGRQVSFVCNSHSPLKWVLASELPGGRLITASDRDSFGVEACSDLTENLRCSLKLTLARLYREQMFQQPGLLYSKFHLHEIINPFLRCFKAVFDLDFKGPADLADKFDFESKCNVVDILESRCRLLLTELLKEGSDYNDTKTLSLTSEASRLVCTAFQTDRDAYQRTRARAQDGEGDNEDEPQETRGKVGMRVIVQLPAGVCFASPRVAGGFVRLVASTCEPRLRRAIDAGVLLTKNHSLRLPFMYKPDNTGCLLPLITPITWAAFSSLPACPFLLGCIHTYSYDWPPEHKFLWKVIDGLEDLPHRVQRLRGKNLSMSGRQPSPFGSEKPSTDLQGRVLLEALLFRRLISIQREQACLPQKVSGEQELQLLLDAERKIGKSSQMEIPDVEEHHEEKAQEGHCEMENVILGPAAERQEALMKVVNEILWPRVMEVMVSKAGSRTEVADALGCFHLASKLSPARGSSCGIRKLTFYLVRNNQPYVLGNGNFFTNQNRLKHCLLKKHRNADNKPCLYAVDVISKADILEFMVKCACFSCATAHMFENCCGPVPI